MRPGHIRVFDGLRVTTEHMEHLQSSFHSAIQDVREILGLGKVYSGFKVVAVGPAQVIVQPGIAFDFERNRIVNDEPKTVDVVFEEQEKEKFVCVQYDQIQDGNVEGQFTLVWDSCSIRLFSSVPSLEENCIPIALLEKTEDEAAFRILPLTLLSEDEVSEETQDKPEEVPKTGSEAEPAVSSPESKSENDSEEGPADIPPNPSVEEPVSMEKQPYDWVCGQGLIALENETGSYLRTLLLEPLLGKFQVGNASMVPIELLVPLTKKTINIGFHTKSITTQTILEAEISMERSEPEVEGGEIGYKTYKFQSSASGEVASKDTQFSQFALTTTHYPQGCSTQPGFSYFEEQGIASLQLTASDDASDLLKQVFQNLKLLLYVAPMSVAKLEAQLHLRWSGNVTKEMLQEIESKKCGLVWRAKCGWKAIGNNKLEQPYS